MAVDLKQTRLGELILKLAQTSSEAIWTEVFSDISFQEWILDLIRQDQLFSKGIDGNGQIIGYYAESTQRRKPQKVAGTRYTLYDTGDFYRSFTIEVYPDILEVDADPIKKGANLFVKYGEDIIKLTDENMEILREEVIRRYYNRLTTLLLNY
jgi:hypothetical protein